MKNSNYTLTQKLGKRIREIRESKNIRQFELAEKLNIEPTNLSKIENGIYFPREDKLNKIVEILGVEIKDLFDIEHIKTKKELISLINKYLENLNENELSFFYKSIKTYTETLKK